MADLLSLMLDDGSGRHAASELNSTSAATMLRSQSIGPASGDGGTMGRRLSFRHAARSHALVRSGVAVTLALTLALGGAAVAIGIAFTMGRASAASNQRSPAFEGHRWLVTAVHHGPTNMGIPRTLNAWIRFDMGGNMGGSDGVNDFSGKFRATSRGYRLVGDITSSAVGVPGPGGAPESTLAVIAAMRQLEQQRTEVSVSQSAGRLTLVLQDYQITAMPTP